MVDPRIAHIIDARILMSMLPRSNQSDLIQIRQEFARFLSAHRSTRHTSWQHAWNDWTGATPSGGGQIRYRSLRCEECKGKRFSHRNVARNLTRTGHPHVCGACGGTGRGTQVTAPVRHADVPTADLSAGEHD